MELDKETPLEYRVTNEVNEDENFFVKQQKELDLFPDQEANQEAYRRFNRFITKGLNNQLYKDGSSNRGVDRPKSYNPAYDALEKKINEPDLPVGEMFKLKDYGLEAQEDSDASKHLYHMKTLGIQIHRPTNHMTTVIPYENNKLDKEEKKEVESFLNKINKKDSAWKIFWKFWFNKLKEL